MKAGPDFAVQRAVAVPIRWRIFGFLFGFGFLAYLQQKTITVAADTMMPALGLSQLQIGYIEQAFVLGYALFQLPGGMVGQRLGARTTFVVIGITAFLATLAMPLVPEFFAGPALFAALFGVQLALGLSQGAIFPVVAGVFEAWFPAKRWALVQGLSTAGLSLGAALTPPLIVFLTAHLGWQRALVWASLPAVPLIALWAWYGRNTPQEHPSVSRRELAEIGAAPPTHSSISVRQIWGLIRNRSVVLLFVSYTSMNYTFYLLSNWVFLYLIQERHFSSLESSWLAMAPPLAAALGAGVGGVVTNGLTQRFGNLKGYRMLPLAAMFSAAALLLVAVNASNPYVAVAALAGCFGTVELTEGAFWGAAMGVGKGDTMAVCGFMNTGGNLGGIISIPIVAYFSGLHAWDTAFFIGVGFAIVSALAWLGIRVEDTAAAPSAAVAGERLAV
ncbi:MAG TPA: MFS transporter [Steroidobacteraceae bacterium]|nr:MFS transporter [Steroidobacteraceae bacterium]